MNRVINFLAAFSTSPLQVLALSRAISTEEWNNRSLTKETMVNLGLKGSPKLSKVLIGLGIDPNRVSNALSGKVKALSKGGGTRVECENVLYLRDQGNSIHYSSCQASDGRAQWYLNGNDSTYQQWWEDEAYWGESLFLWYAGEPMHLDGQGYIARAKLRVMYHGSRVGGLYIDRPYGQYSVLLDNLGDLEDWWNSYSLDKGWELTPLLMAPVWQRDNGSGRDFQAKFAGLYPIPLSCPSTKGGYQDTLLPSYEHYDCFLAVNDQVKSLAVQAYKARQKEVVSRFSGEEKTYMECVAPLSAVSYNPQAGGISLKRPVDKPWRGFLSKQFRDLVKLQQSLMGYASGYKLSSGYLEFVFNGSRYSLYATPSSWHLSDLDLHCRVAEYHNGTLEVLHHSGDFSPAEDVSWKTETKHLGLELSRKKKYIWKGSELLSYTGKFSRGNAVLKEHMDGDCHVLEILTDDKAAGIQKAIPLPTLVLGHNAKGEAVVVRGEGPLQVVSPGTKGLVLENLDGDYIPCDPYYMESRLYVVERRLLDLHGEWGEPLVDGFPSEDEDYSYAEYVEHSEEEVETSHFEIDPTSLYGNLIFF